MNEHPKGGAEYAPETCEGCAGSFGPCYSSQVQRREAERGPILAAAEREAGRMLTSPRCYCYRTWNACGACETWNARKAEGGRA